MSNSTVGEAAIAVVRRNTEEVQGKKVIRPLTDPAAFDGDPADAFDVYVPSLPGFGFSTPLNRPDMNFWKMADLFHTLMTQTLGYSKYAASGSDYGALVTGQLGHKYANNLYGIHLGRGLRLNMFQSERPWDVTEGNIVPDGVPEEIRDGIIAYQRRFASHVAVHIDLARRDGGIAQLEKLRHLE